MAIQIVLTQVLLHSVHSTSAEYPFVNCEIRTQRIVVLTYRVKIVNVFRLNDVHRGRMSMIFHDPKSIVIF